MSVACSPEPPKRVSVNRDMEQAVTQGHFRADLDYRLSLIPRIGWFLSLTLGFTFGTLPVVAGVEWSSFAVRISMTTKARATIEDLYQVPDNAKAEIVRGELVSMSPTGARPGRASFNIAASLREHERRHTSGYAFGDNVGFIVKLPERDSFSPDAAWFLGNIAGMDFLEGPPAFAAEVRSKNDYGPHAEQDMAKKRSDYFSAGTLVVWDVDLLSDETVRVYRASDPDRPAMYRRGEVAEAEPAVPGWVMPVDDLFA